VAIVHFTAVGDFDPGEERRVTAVPTATLRGLWFDAAVSYTLSGYGYGGELTLGNGVGNYAHIIVVRRNATTGASTDINWGAETNINKNIAIYGVGLYRRIENLSEGGLALNGEVVLNSNNLFIEGGRAIRFGGILFSGPSNLPSGQNNNRIKVRSDDASSPTHLILSGNNLAIGSNANYWGGELTIESQGFVITKHEHGLGGRVQVGTVLHQVNAGGTVGWRWHDDGSTFSSLGVSALAVLGQGVVRQTGTDPVGAIYNDGGWNSHGNPSLAQSKFGWIEFSGDTWVGSRGDINGGLTLYGRIYGDYSFTKGPGLITLSNVASATGFLNNWAQTEIRDGVLRINYPNALPSANIRFTGGILELGSLDSVFWIRQLGSGANQVHWMGDGGFSALQSSNVMIGNAQNLAVQLTWGQQYFVGSGHALLLSSRYAGDIIFFYNPINLGNSASDLREIRVERALSTDASAQQRAAQNRPRALGPQQCQQHLHRRHGN